MDINYLTPSSDEPCTKHSAEYLAPPQQFLQQVPDIIYSADGGPVVDVTNIEWRIVSWLRAAAALKDPLELLKRSAVAFYIAGLGTGSDPQNSVEGANALADLSVTGSASFDAFRRKLPKESDLLNDVSQRLITVGGGPPDPTRTLSSVRGALDRAYKVAWALRDADPVRRQQTRASFGWIAVCGEDDPPHRPVNVPSAPYPQFTLPVALNITVQTRFAVASLNVPPLPQGYPVPGQQFPIPGGPDIVRSFPQDITPSIPPDDEVILFIHGHSSRIEEFGDIAPALLNAAKANGKSYSIIALDLPCNGYSLVDANDSMFDHTTVAPNLPDFWCSDPTKLGLPTTPLLDYLLSFVLRFIDTLDLIVPIKDRIAAVMGGSLGGNLTLRVAENGPPWLKHIIAWSSASVWTTQNNDFPRCLALGPTATKMQEDEGYGLDARFRYFYAAFDGDTVNIAGIITLPPQPQLWYRDGWDCKGDYINDARLDRRETYNQFYRRWHWRVALEQLLFSHWDQTVPPDQPRFTAISVPTLLAAADKDDYDWSNIYSASIKVAQAMVNTPGRGIFFQNTGHSIDNERPQLFAQQIMGFLRAPSRLTANQQLNVNDQLLSPNGKFKLVMQGDGNLVLYSLDTSKAVWASNTWDTPVTHAIMQADGNFVCYDDNGKAYWASNTSGHPGAFAVLQDDGNLGVLSGDYLLPRPLWAYDRLLPNQQLNVNQQLVSPNGKFKLVMQADGNLVLYSLDTNKAVWASNTWDTPVTHAIMQADGNFVCYDDNGKAYWSSNTWGHPNAFVVLQGDGRLVVSEMSIELLLGIGLWASDLCIPNVPWQNYPKTFPSLTPTFTCVPATIDDIITIVTKAEAEGKKVHARGSGWSFSDCAVTNDYFITTAQLNKELQTVQKALISGAPTVYHVQAGISIHDLYMNLDNLLLALETMGGSSGQTLAGAISTGTHGGDKFIPPLADSVLAIHLIATGGTQFWIEPSLGITDPTLLKKFVIPSINPTNIIYNDSVFNAVLVSIGCMGIIYAVVLRVRPKYNLIETTTETNWQYFKTIASQEINDLGARFLQVVINPYPYADGTNMCHVTTRAEAESTSALLCTQGNVDGARSQLTSDLIAANPFEAAQIPQDNLVDAVNYILQHAAGLRAVLTNDYPLLMRAVLPPGTCGGPSFSVMDTSRRYPGNPGHNGNPPDPSVGDSVEVFIDVAGKWIEFVDALINFINSTTDTFLVGYVAVRFMPRSRALLAMQQWQQTCSVEISALGADDLRVVGERELLSYVLELAYQFGGLPHWGQLNNLSVSGHGSLYPGFTEWRRVYASMSSGFTTRTFESALSIRWQLTVPDSHVVFPVRVPNLIGLTVPEATQKLQSVGLLIQANVSPLPGPEQVFYQRPLTDVPVQPGSTITVSVL